MLAASVSIEDLFLKATNDEQSMMLRYSQSFRSLTPYFISRLNIRLLKRAIVESVDFPTTRVIKLLPEQTLRKLLLFESFYIVMKESDIMILLNYRMVGKYIMKTYVTTHVELSESFLMTYTFLLDFNRLYEHQFLPEVFIRKFGDKLPPNAWVLHPKNDYLSRSNILSMESRILHMEPEELLQESVITYIRDHIKSPMIYDPAHMLSFFRRKEIPLSVINIIAPNIMLTSEWTRLLRNQKKYLSLKDFSSLIDRYDLIVRLELATNVFPECVLEKYKAWVNWKTVSCYTSLSEEFLVRNCVRIAWSLVRKNMGYKFVRQLVAKHHERLFAYLPNNLCLMEIHLNN